MILIFFAGIVTGGTLLAMVLLCLGKKWAKECPEKLDEGLELLKSEL